MGRAHPVYGWQSLIWDGTGHPRIYLLPPERSERKVRMDSPPGANTLVLEIQDPIAGSATSHERLVQSQAGRSHGRR